MKKSFLILVGMLALGTLVACSGGEDAAPAEQSGVKATDNPSVGAPVGAGGGPVDGGTSTEEGAPSGSKPPPPGRRGEKK